MGWSQERRVGWSQEEKELKEARAADSISAAGAQYREEMGLPPPSHGNPQTCGSGTPPESAEQQVTGTGRRRLDACCEAPSLGLRRPGALSRSHRGQELGTSPSELGMSRG